MLVGKARLQSTVCAATRAGYCFGIAALFLLVGSKSLQNAIAEGDTRTISMHHIHTDEDISITYKRNGRYDEEALKKLNWFLRDWRREEEIKMDPRLLDLVWEVDREVGKGQPVWVVCGYRAPATNAMLRRRSRGVARYSQHTHGRAMDFYIPHASLEEIRVAGLRLQRGGVGYYPTSGSPFVHLDTGSVRHWPRMTHDQLAKVFPTGRTVHIPSDGHPLPGYALALADISKRGGSPSGNSLEAARESGVNLDNVVASADRPKNLLAKLFSFGKDKDEDEEADTAASPAPEAAPAPTRLHTKRAILASAERRSDKKEPAVSPSAATPAPKPAAQVAAALAPAPLRIASIPVVRNHIRPARPAQAASLAAAGGPTPNDVIASRGYWQGLPDGMMAAQPAPDSADSTESAPPAKRIETASADPDLTSAVGPWRLSDDRVPPELALAYAAQSRPQTQRAFPMGAARPPRDTTVAFKRTATRPTLLASGQSSTPMVKAGTHYDDPWLRAVVLSPSVHNYLTITLLGPRDFRRLEPLMQKPARSVMMTFSSDPLLGLEHEHFSGSAIVFMSTVTYSTRTAALQ